MTSTRSPSGMLHSDDVRAPSPMSSQRHLKMLQLGQAWFPLGHGGGSDRYYYNLVRQFRKEGMEVRGHVAGDESVSAQTSGAVTAFAGQTDSLYQRLKGARKSFIDLVSEMKFDVVASHCPLYAWPVRRELKRLPYVVHFHGPWADEVWREGHRRWAHVVRRSMERQVYAPADRFITLSRAFANLLIERYGADEAKIRVIPGGVDCGAYAVDASRQEARERLAWPADRPIVLCVRRLRHRMGLENVVAAMTEVVRHHHDALVMIAGRGPLESELRAQIEAASLADHIRLLGFVPDEILPLAYRAADLSLVPTESLEGFGLITLESLAAGTPVLVTPVGGLPEAVSGLDERLVLAGNSPAEIQAGLCAALDGSLPLPGVEACQKYVRDNFHWPTIAGRILEVYEEVCLG